MAIPDEYPLPNDPNHPEIPCPDDQCPNCHQKGGVVWTWCQLLEGSLEYYFAVHTEIDNHFRCDRCHTDWKEWRIL